MKKIISAMMIAVILVTTIAPMSGCSRKNTDTITMGQWVMFVVDAFGMQNYVNETPYFAKVTKDSAYFAAFQMVAEWEIMEPSDDITSDTLVKWRDVLISLVNAGEFLDANATDDEKIDYAILNFDPNIRMYWSNRNIGLGDALSLLDVAQSLWASKEYIETIEKASFAEGVYDYINEEGLIYSAQENMIISSSSELMGLQVGDVYTLPACNGISASINRVEAVEIIDGNIIITNDETFTEEEALDYIEEIIVQETVEPDFSKITGIYDEYGNPIDFEIVEDSMVETTGCDAAIQGVTLTYSETEKNEGITQTGLFDNVKGKLKFKVDGYAITIGASKDDISIELSKEIEKKSNRYRKQTQQIYTKVTFDDVSVTKDIDYSWGKLHSATIKLDYKTKIEGGIKTEREQEVGKPDKDNGDIESSISSIIKQYKTALGNINTEVRNSKCNEDIYICKLAIAEGGLASVDFIVKGKVTAEGDVKIVFEIEGAQGVQYKDGNLRYIKSKNFDCDFVAEGSIEITVAPGLAITLLKKIALIEIVLEAGLGAAVEMTAHLFDAEGHELYAASVCIPAIDADSMSNEDLQTTAEEVERYAEEVGGYWDRGDYTSSADIKLMKGVCLEWKLYPILKFGIDGECLFGKLAKKLNVQVSVEFLGKNDAFLEGHIDTPNTMTNLLESNSFSGGLKEFLGIGKECTFAYTPWDEAKENEGIEDTEDTEDTEGADDSEKNDIITADTIILSTMRITLVEGGTQKIIVEGLPEGYKLEDIIFKTDDPQIATVDIKTSEVKGIKEGVTCLVVQTKDGKYMAYCAVTVISDEEIDFNELPSGELT